MFIRFFIIINIVVIIISTLLKADDIKDINMSQQTDQNVERQKRSLQQVTPFTGGAKINTNKKVLIPTDKDLGRCFTFNEIKITGNTVVSSKSIKKITNRYINKCISIAIAQEYLLEEIINIYQSKGYILAVPYLPEQNINQGVLEIIIQEGILEDIDFDTQILPKRVVNMAFFGLKGEVVNIRHLEQALENLNKFGAVAVNMDLKPGSESGQSILILRVEEKFPFSGSISYNNDYNSISYPYFPNQDDHKISVSMSYAHLLGNDNLMLNANTTMQTAEGSNRVGSFGFAYSAPIGYWDFIFNANYDMSHNINRMIFDTYNIRTLSLTSSVDIKRTLSRGQSYILKSIIRPNYYTTDTYLDDIKTASGYKLYFLDLGFEYQYFSQNIIIYSNLTYTRGQPLFGLNKQGREDNQHLLIPQNIFDLGKLTLNVTVPIANRVSYINRFSAQYTPDILYTINDFIVISSAGVRGYEGVYANYNSGFVTQNDIVIDLFSFENSYVNKIAASLGFDTGAAIDGYNGQITHDKVLMGWAFEVKTQGRVNLSFSYARPLNHIYILGAVGSMGDIFTLKSSASITKTQVDYAQQESTYVGSNILGENIKISSGGDTQVKGSVISASNDVEMQSEGTTSIEAGENSFASQKSYDITNHSLEVSVGVGASTVLTGGTASVNVSYSFNKTEGVDYATAKTHTGSIISGGGNVNLASKQDINLIGSNVYGNNVATSAQNLNIESLQNEYHNWGSSTSYGFSVSIGTGVAGSDNTNGSIGVNYSESKYDSYKLVTETVAGISAKENLNIEVANNVNLKGAILEGGDKVNLQANNLNIEDLQDISKNTNSSWGVGYTYSFGVSDEVRDANLKIPGADSLVGLKEVAQKINAINTNSLGFNVDIGKSSSTTITAVHGGINKVENIEVNNVNINNYD